MKKTLLLALAGALAGCTLFPHIGSDPGSPYPDNEAYADDEGPFHDPSSSTNPKPDFGKTVRAGEAPPPLSGGTMMILGDGRIFAADPDRDKAYVVDASSKKVVTIALAKHDEPGRAAVDADGRVHLVLRRGGAVATIDVDAGVVLARRDVCAAPRGIAFDGDRSRLLVACESGQLVALGPAPTDAVTPVAQLDRDLRDVIVTDGHTYVSRFRTAEILELTWDGGIVGRTRPDVSSLYDASEAMVGWRMISAPGGDGPVLAHEIASRNELVPVQYYGDVINDDCNPTTPTFSAVSRGRGRAPLVLPSNAVLPVDVDSDGYRFAVVAAGNGHTKQLPQVYIIGDATTDPNADPSLTGGCAGVFDRFEVSGQATSVVLRRGGGVVVLSREPAQLELLPEKVIISLAQDSREDTGHAIFHSNSGSGVACATCHGEGGDDGRVWQFQDVGRRRTPSLLGTLDGTAPYHWSGDERDIAQIADDVMTQRMSGPALDDSQKAALQSWLFALPAPAAVAVDATAAARGKTLFQSAATGCTSCHSGPKLTSSQTVDVGTGGAFQVPSLVGVAARAPYLHDGCAATLTERFGSCGGGDRHGTTSQLGAADLADLVAYLSTL